MDILHHGAVNGVTGSCHELRLPAQAGQTAKGILIDCGLFQGAETSGQGGSNSSSNGLEIDFPITHIQALVVTHVHIDHVGRIPSLLGAGFTGPIYCTEPSAILLPVVLEDAVKIGFTRNRRLIDRVINQLKRQIVAVPYHRWQSVEGLASLAVRFSPAGHILGSAYVTCRYRKTGTRKTGTEEKIVFSGDLGAPWAPLLPSPKSPWGCDRLVIESTYGDSVHEGRRERREKLRHILEHAMADGGTVLVPAFSIGRTQELLYELEAIIHSYRNRPVHGRFSWDDIEILVDSPLAATFTDFYRQLKPYWDKEARRRLNGGRHPLSFDNLTTIDSHQDHLSAVKYLQRHSRPSIVLAASGMCTGGRIVNYLKALIGDARTDVLFVGYQAAGTPGRDIQRWGPKGGYVVLDGQRFDIGAGIHTLRGYSAHADADNLVNFVTRMRHKPREIRIVHGDAGAKLALKQRLGREICEAEVLIP